MRRMTKKRRWRRFLLSYALCFLILGAAGCALLYRYCDAYEQALPSRAMDALLADTAPETWYAPVRERFRDGVSPYEDGEALYAAYFEAVLRDAPISYRKQAGVYTDTQPVYALRAAGRTLCTATLLPDRKLGFGKTTWRLGAVEPAFPLEELPHIAVEVLASEGTELRLNGAALKQGESVPHPGLTPLEARFASVPGCVRYRVDALYGEIAVTDADGRLLSPLTDGSDDAVRYELLDPPQYAFTVRAPEGVSVSVCGTELTEADVTERSAGILDGLSDAESLLTYAADGLYTKPVFIARDADGTELLPLINETGELRYFLPNEAEAEAELRSYTERFFERYMAYSSQAYDAGRHQALLGCILPDTELYAYIRDSKAAMIWASATTVDYDELTFSDFHAVTDALCTCTIRYKADFSATAWYESYEYDLQNAYELAFVKRDGVWYAAAMSLIAG